MIIYYLLRSSALILIGLLIYAQTFQFDFVFDDYIFIVNNPFIKNLSNFHVMWHAFPMTRLVGMYSFALNYHFCQLAPQGYHIFNFMVHLICVGLIWALADQLFIITNWLPAKDRLTKELPFIIAVIFLVHPCQTQAVTYITQRFESMATLLYLGTIYFYLRARLSTGLRHKVILFGLAAFFTILGVMTKEVVITVPAMILACEWILFPNEDKKRFYIFFIVAGGLLYVFFTKMLHMGISNFLHTSVSESHDGDLLTPSHYFLTQMRVFLTFLRLLVLPIHQNLDYDYPASGGFFHPPLTLVGAGVLLGIIYLIIRLRRKIPLISFGLAWMLVTFSVNLAPRANVIFEHKLYLISFGFFLTIVAALSIWVKDRGTLLRILCCMIVILSIVSFNRNKVWANELALWTDSIKNSPDKARVNANLGRVYGSRGQYDQAIYYLSRAIAISPDNITYENRGIIYSQKGQGVQALKDMDKSIAMDPGYFPTYMKRSWVYQSQQNYDAAFADLKRAILLNSYYTDAYIERGLLWMQIGRPQEAVKDFTVALGLEPANTTALQYKTYCLSKMGSK